MSGYKEGHYIMNMALVHLEEIPVVDIYTPNIGALKCKANINIHKERNRLQYGGPN